MRLSRLGQGKGLLAWQWDKEGKSRFRISSINAMRLT